MTRAHFPYSQLDGEQEVLDFRVPRTSSTNSSPSFSSSAQDATILSLEGEELHGCGGQIDDLVADTENHSCEANSIATKASAEQATSSEGGTINRKIRQRFGPDEDYLLAVQVNADAPYAAAHGDINKQWQSVAEKLNSSPNFCMKPIKGVTATARFKTLLDKHRTWEAISAQKSGTDEEETPFIQIMTELVASITDYEATTATLAATKKGEKEAKEQSGEVVRCAAVSRIKLGKRHSRSGSDSEEKDEGFSRLNRSTNRSNQHSDWQEMFEATTEQRSKTFREFLQAQQAEQRLRLEFEREERMKDRAERELERKERQLERENRQKEREDQAKLIAKLLELVTKTSN